MGYRQINNPYGCIKCETRADDCGCCETGWENGYLDLIIVGCDGAPARQLISFIRHRSADTLPCNVNLRYPATAPCGVFWGIFSVGTTSCTGDDGENWSGAAGLMIWCDRADPDMPYKAEAYCYDDNTECYEYVGDCPLSNYQCTCNGPTFWVQLPDPMPCCCNDQPLITNCCCPDGMPQTLTWDDGTNTGTLTWNGTNWTGTGDITGCTGSDISLQCIDVGGMCFFDLVIGDSPVQFGNVGGTCDPFEVIFGPDSFVGCSGGPWTVTITG